MPGRLLIFLTAILMPINAVAMEDTSVVVAVVRHGSLDRAGVAAVHLQPVASPSSIDHGQATITRTIDLRNDESVDLAPGYWGARVESGSWWNAEQYFAAPSSQKVTLDVWPLAWVSGKIILDDGTKLPTEIGLRFARANEKDDLPERGEVMCLVDPNRRFRCPVPAGSIDVRLHSHGFISRFWWGISPAAEGTYDVGPVRLKQGQAIFGRVELPKGANADMAHVTVTATPAAVGDTNEPLVAGGRMLPAPAVVSGNGRFQIDGLPPGPYVLSASHPTKLVAAPVQVMVRAGTEMELVEPLRLDRPSRLFVSVSPPVDPSGARWHINVSRFATDRYLVPVTSSACSVSGVFEMAAVQPGKYQVTIGDLAGSIWYQDNVSLATDARLIVQATSHSVRGMLTLVGGKALEGSITFQDHDGHKAVAHATADGKYTVVLPGRSTRWDIAVRTKRPTVARTIRDQEIRNDADPAIFDIEVPAAVLMGTVVDAGGSSIASAIVSLRRTSGGDQLIQSTSEADGSFAIYGLDTASYTLSAAFRAMQSAEMSIDAKDDASPEPVRVVMKDIKKLQGIVVSDTGPVPGATVTAAATDVPQTIVASRVTDANGAFEAWLPPDTREFDVVVAAPGYAYMLDHVRFEDGKHLNAKLYQRGGALSLPNDPKLQLVHGGGIITLGELASEWSGRLESGEGHSTHIAIDMMEPGVYSLCRVDAVRFPLFRMNNGATGGDCVAGFLPPQGTLVLDVKH